jgi:NAD(P)-dependent dehydrogenase (short-subunit alcohol dehydrogenase family)
VPAEDLIHKVALVTGGGNGIGRASAQLFSRAGYAVVVADVDAGASKETVRLIASAGGSAVATECDVSDEESVASTVQVAIDTFGRLDAAHNTVGISPATGDTISCTRETWDRVLAVNLTGTWLCMKYEILAMRDSGGGAIVNTSSSAGLTGVAGIPAYATSKHGLIGLTKVAALENATRSIRINVICPGSTRTPGLEDKVNQGFLDLESHARSAPLGRIAEPAEIAEAACWLCSDAASFITGTVLSVDGGKLAGLMSFSSSSGDGPL